MRLHHFVLTALALVSLLPPRLAFAQRDGIRWDIVHVTRFNPVTFQPGGQASAIEDSDNWKLTLTGAGSFVPGQPNSASGGGSWNITDGKGAIIGAGTYQVAQLVQWAEYCGTAPSALPSTYVDQIAEAQVFREGTAVLSVLYTDSSSPSAPPESGVITLFDRPDLSALPPPPPTAGPPAAPSAAHTAALKVACCMPAPLPLGITATLDFHAFWNREPAQPGVDGDRVAFHAVVLP